MKNIADVNSEDILSELNNLDYDDDDLKLLDDEDIKPINSKTDDDLDSFYMDYDDKKVDGNIDLFTEQPKVAPINVVEKPKVEETKKSEIVIPNVDEYLNRAVTERTQKGDKKVESTKTVLPDIPNPLVNTAKPAVEEIPSYVKPQVTVSKQPSVNDSIEMKDLSQLFDKVSNNVKGASEIVNRNAEIKRKIEERFNELRRLQQEHEANKKSDYEEINSYKEEVYSKLQQKKADIEKDLVDLRTSQEKLAKEKLEFETYKNTSLANLKILEKDLKDSYESRNKDIEQVEIGLVKRKEQLDLERSNLAKEREAIEKERATLAENLLQFNKLVDDFTNGINNFN